MKRRHFIGSMIASLLLGLMAGAALTIPAFSESYPDAMRNIPVFVHIPETGFDGSFVRANHNLDATEGCENLARRFGLSIADLSEAGFDLRVSAMVAIKDNALQQAWRSMNWRHRLQVTYLGPTDETRSLVRTEVLALRTTAGKQAQVADIANGCAGRTPVGARP